MRVTFRCDPALIDILPRPKLAREAIPDWLKSMPAKAFSDLHGRDVRTVKQCPPFVDAMAHGFMISLPCDVRVEGGVFEWDWPAPPITVDQHPASPLSFHPPAQVLGTPLHRPDAVLIKFNSFWTIELETGWSLFATHPVNRPDLPFRLLSGLVDADHFHDGGINFPATWLDPEFQGVLPKGMPVAQCFAVPRARPELVFETLEGENAIAYSATVAEILAAPNVYRKRFRQRK
ncbi:hypothetical protein [Noviherbaspirillum galbum]|uniref:Uncharacterized protein n=1 Tax=Noviherbaspirillum galbum TaxID=2709383 RepID=A0A6B3SUY1_9BURK|nr:hypothetical protein [Noviherbaspirillum galbum]NEX64860.1 hypothetical protein [Noviherbaspirillum galbum]